MFSFSSSNIYCSINMVPFPTSHKFLYISFYQLFRYWRKLISILSSLTLNKSACNNYNKKRNLKGSISFLNKPMVWRRQDKRKKKLPVPENFHPLCTPATFHDLPRITPSRNKKQENASIFFYYLKKKYQNKKYRSSTMMLFWDGTTGVCRGRRGGGVFPPDFATTNCPAV